MDILRFCGNSVMQDCIGYVGNLYLAESNWMNWTLLWVFQRGLAYDGAYNV